METDEKRCRYSDCREKHPVASENEQVTCSTCRLYLGLPAGEKRPTESMGRAYYTGLPPGEENDRITSNGRDFITRTTDDGSGPFVITSDLTEMTEKDFSALIGRLNPAEWVIVRAMTAEDARGSHMDAFDQHRAFECGSPDWQLLANYEDETIRDRIINGGRAPIQPLVCPYCGTATHLRPCATWKGQSAESDTRDTLNEYQCHFTPTCRGRSFWV